jgi:predicted nucleic acid-binding protein
MIVVDANVIAYVWFPSPYRDAVFSLMDSDQKWEVPQLWRSEFQNIAAAYLRNGYYTFSQVVDIVQKAESMLNGNDHVVKSVAVLNLVNQSGCSAYDCEYVALAKELNVKLITYDKKILKDFADVAMTAEAYVSYLEGK